MGCRISYILYNERAARIQPSPSNITNALIYLFQQLLALVEVTISIYDETFAAENKVNKDMRWASVVLSVNTVQWLMLVRQLFMKLCLASLFATNSEISILLLFIVQWHRLGQKQVMPPAWIFLRINIIRLECWKIFKYASFWPTMNKGRFCNNSGVHTLILKRLSIENKAKLSQLTRADFVTIPKLTH